MGATRVSCMIMFILAGAAFLTKTMAFTGIPRELAEWVDGMHLSPYALIAVLVVVYLVLGTALDGISMIVLTAAVVLPMIQKAGFDLVWFGIFIVLLVEIAEVTPPVGFNLFVLQNMTGKDSNTIARAAMPFFVCLVICIALITLFPQVVTLRPQRRDGRRATLPRTRTDEPSACISRHSAPRIRRLQQGGHAPGGGLVGRHWRNRDVRRVVAPARLLVAEPPSAAERAAPPPQRPRRRRTPPYPASRRRARRRGLASRRAPTASPPRAPHLLRAGRTARARAGAAVAHHAAAALRPVPALTPRPLARRPTLPASGQPRWCARSAPLHGASCSGGGEVEGQTIGHVEPDFGVFLFHPPSTPRGA